MGLLAQPSRSETRWRRSSPPAYGPPRGWVALVRHASTAWSGHRYGGRGDPWLSPEGRAAASDLAAGLADDRSGMIRGEVRIVSSPLRRARQTAGAISVALGGAAVTLDPRWAEADFGDLEGCTFAAIERRDPVLAARLAAGEVAIDWPGGETAAALAARVSAAWIDIARVAAGQAAGASIVVSHAGPLRLAIALAERVDPRAVAVPAPAAAIRVTSPAIHV